MTTSDAGTFHGDMAYLAVGVGPPVISIRPVMPSSDNPRGLTRWAEQRALAALTRHFTVYSIGRRPGLTPGLTMSELAAHYAEAIDHGFGDAVDVLGVSTAGSVALQLAADHPGLVRRLVVAATACRLGEDGRRMQRRYADLLARGGYRKAEAALSPAIADSRLGQRLMSGVMALSPRPQDPGGMVAMLLAEDTFDLCGRLSDITAPTLVIAGERDRLYPPDLARRTADGIPGAALQMYPDRMHHTVARGPRFSADVTTFLTGAQS
ncbi:alpha/beta fold hydrolase [Mycolicibacterium sp. HK-90]|uniref:alpha/beta fold hydrolase n=1 Tax=Mycolicibacterium sp. HK-90 TaxID=3056937 RepID=UPI002657BC66|nr:alpha/beta hydrolase [Mycolicibacterium sp. HK-90]WKG04135.1 alpha/beta hydrolase [Mycolicibacterium sp. HK-90]